MEIFMVMESACIRTEIAMKVAGSMTAAREKENIPGKTAPITKAISLMEIFRATENVYMRMATAMRVKW